MIGYSIMILIWIGILIGGGIILTLTFRKWLQSGAQKNSRAERTAQRTAELRRQHPEDHRQIEPQFHGQS